MSSDSESRKGLVVGAFKTGADDKEDSSPLNSDQLTETGRSFNQQTKGRLIELLNCTKPLGSGDSRILFGLDQNYKAVSVVDLGERGTKEDITEQLHQGKENVRCACSTGVTALRKVGMTNVEVDGCGHPEAAAEGAYLGLFCYDELKKESDREKQVSLQLADFASEDSTNERLWEEGKMSAEAQNLSRKLTEMPANLLSPTKFAEIAQNLFANSPNVTVSARDKEWAENQNMNSFLSVAKGSDRAPVFLEIHMKPSENGSKKRPVVLVGKGVCFDSGGISLKPSLSMDKMRGDMGGAACVLASGYGISGLLGGSLCRELILLIPLVDNLPSGKASCPGDIVNARNGKSIKIDNTDAEGRLILADALCYADDFKPEHVIDLATLTGAVGVALGCGASAVYSNSDELWKDLHGASVYTGDRVWRMPLFKCYSKRMKTDYADLNNIAKPGSGGGSCTAAAFLKEFTECKSWAHWDIAGVMEGDGEIPYLSKGMTGKSTFISFSY